MSRVRVTQAQTAENPRPVQMQAGDPVRVERRDPDEPAWLWVHGPGGRSGWTFRTFLSGDEGDVQAARDYDGTELDVQPGDAGEALETLDGWTYCRLDDGQRGWIRASRLEAVTGDPAATGDME